MARCRGQPRIQGQRHAIGLAGPRALALAEGAALHQTLHMVVMAVLGAAHLQLEPQHLGPVLAQRAVHRRITPHHIVHPLLEGGQHLRVVPQVAGVEQLDGGMVGGHPLAVLHDPADQHAGKEEVGEHHNAAVPQPHHMAQPRLHQREGDPGIQGLAPTKAKPLHQHAGHLGHIRVGVRIGGSPPHHHQQGVVPRQEWPAGRTVGAVGGLQAGLDAGAGRLDHLAVHAELAAVVDPQPRLGGVGVEHRGDVVLGVAGREQHRRDRQHVAHTPATQGIEAVAQDRSGELQVAEFHRHRRQALLELVGQGGELLHRQTVAAAVAADQHADRAVGTLRLQRSSRQGRGARDGGNGTGGHGLQRLCPTLSPQPGPARRRWRLRQEPRPGARMDRCALTP